MAGVREQIEIDAPIEAVWNAVHRDIRAVPRWSKNVTKTEVIGGGPVAMGTELRYTTRLPGGLTQDLTLLVKTYDELRRCAGSLEGSVMKGTWSWRYSRKGEMTVVVYETDVALRGVLRFAGPAVRDQVRRNVRSDLEALKKHVEQGRKRASTTTKSSTT